VIDRVGMGALGVLGLSILLTPWFAMDDYTPNGWDATWWARIALIAAIAGIVLMRIGRTCEAAAAAVLALACVAVRAIAVPDFGFGFDGLDVPVDRSWGLWIALAAGVIAVAATARVSSMTHSAARTV
jgi:hypothetical protein